RPAPPAAPPAERGQSAREGAAARPAARPVPRRQPAPLNPAKRAACGLELTDKLLPPPTSPKRQRGDSLPLAGALFVRIAHAHLAAPIADASGCGEHAPPKVLPAHPGSSPRHWGAPRSFT